MMPSEGSEQPEGVLVMLKVLALLAAVLCLLACEETVVIGYGSGDAAAVSDAAADGTGDESPLKPAVYQAERREAVPLSSSLELVAACHPGDLVLDAGCREGNPVAASPLVIDTSTSVPPEGWKCVGRNTAGCSAGGACYTPSPVLVAFVVCMSVGVGQ